MALIVLGVIKWGDNSSAPQFVTKEVRRGDIVVIVTATGTLEPTQKVDVGSELSGIMKTVEANYNDQVECNQVLARLDTSKFELSVAQSEAALQNAKANVLLAEAKLKEADREHKRQKALRLEGAVAQIKLDEKETDLEKAFAEEAGAKAEVIRAKAALDAAQTELSKAFIRSPINGIVLARNVEPGQTVAAAFQAPVLFTLAEDLTRMELQVDVDEADVSKVKKDQEAVFTVDAHPNRSFHARITQTRFGSKTVGGVVTYKTILSVDNSDLSLRPGMTATARITVMKIEDALLAPSVALRFTPPVQEKKKSVRDLAGMLLPTPPGGKGASGEINITKEDGTGKVWRLKDDHLVPISVTVGATDETWTEIRKGALELGMALAVDVIEASQ